MDKIILASASPRRKELLERAGVVFQIIPGTGEEKISTDDPAQAVMQLSAEKAFFVTEGLERSGEAASVIIGADTVVAYRDKILGKPSDAGEAVRTLTQLQGNTHQVYTGVTVLVRDGSEWVPHTFFECTEVTFYPVSQEEIRSYVETGEPMDKAGSYGIQGPWGIYVKGICGDYNNVVGLPVARLLQETKKYGIDMRG